MKTDKGVHAPLTDTKTPLFLSRNSFEVELTISTFAGVRHCPPVA
jgi:hypothetical protein